MLFDIDCYRCYETSFYVSGITMMSCYLKISVIREYYCAIENSNNDTSVLGISTIA